MILFRFNRNNVFVAFLAFVLTTTIVRAGGHFVRIVLLAAAGLLGMWMLHMLALDFQNIRKGLMFARTLLRIRRDVSLNPAIGNGFPLEYRTLKDDMVEDFDKKYGYKQVLYI